MTTTLDQLSRLRSAPVLSSDEQRNIREELAMEMRAMDWFTVGVMASCSDQAILAMRSLETRLGWDPLDVVDSTTAEGPVYLKANQKTGTIRIRIEHGLGEGILISGHGDDDTTPSTTWGPLPLDFFS
jgi:hypothetical protein